MTTDFSQTKSTQNGPTQQIVEDVIQACRDSEQNLSTAAEQIANEGIKLLLRTYAQQRAEFAAELQRLEHPGAAPTEASADGNALQSGWTTIRVGMVVGQKNRLEAGLKELLEREKQLLDVYEQALELNVPEWIRGPLSEQRSQIGAAYTRIGQLVSESGQRLVVELFDSPDAAQQAADRLREADLVVGDVVLESVAERVKPYAGDAADRAQSTWGATLTATIIGAVIGLLMGLLYGVLRIQFDPLVTWAEAGLGSIALSGLIGALVAASFGSFFGFLVGRNASEEDATFYDRSLQEGRTLLLVSTPVERAKEVAEFLLVQHQHELTGNNGHGPRVPPAQVGVRE